MKKKLSEYKYLFIVGLIGIFLGCIFTYSAMTIYQQKSPLGKINNFYQKLKKTYYCDISDKRLISGAIDGMLNSLSDPYSQKLEGNHLKQINGVLTGNSFGGIGVEMQVFHNKIVICSVLRDTPAFKAHIKVNDELIGVNGKNVDARNFMELSKMIRGKIGTKVTLTLIRNNKKFDVTIVRANIKQSTVSVRQKGSATIIAISQFDVNTAKDLREALKNAKVLHSKKLIIDLRNNPGGIMEQAMTCAAYFVPYGKIIMKYEGRNEHQIIRSNKKLSNNFRTKLKPIIIINQHTASASEIFTAALVDNQCAVTVGQHSFGKGTVQQVGADDNVEYKFTIAKWLTPRGKWINKRGIKPTYETPVSDIENLPKFQTNTLLKYNMMGLDIAILQKYLMALGYLSNNLTGVYDNATLNSVKMFQKDNNLKVTGIVNKDIRYALYVAAYNKFYNDDVTVSKALSIDF